ncbi:hypothetical protein CROQUDRAFT_696487 [Cronartium quercuum f. sp. fusiforme G11]|uniref:Uncharacterized protein n=1 Tax=Cronartium quercuum f. sp. fusiforme G11 TaxID=708437 RepID=A0A9P6NQR8_9BASI|nr:hypothetical protein CROQUDRAFT_696487 [Cronartium quercuum f. sp. fusiforme G11]
MTSGKRFKVLTGNNQKSVEYMNSSEAIHRSCKIQKNLCSNFANGPQGKTSRLTVQDCEVQVIACEACNKNDTSKCNPSTNHNNNNKTEKLVSLLSSPPPNFQSENPLDERNKDKDKKDKDKKDKDKKDKDKKDKEKKKQDKKDKDKKEKDKNEKDKKDDGKKDKAGAGGTCPIPVIEKATSEEKTMPGDLQKVI